MTHSRDEDKTLTRSLNKNAQLKGFFWDGPQVPDLTQQGPLMRRHFEADNISAQFYCVWFRVKMRYIRRLEFIRRGSLQTIKQSKN
jgi:hypothetical protein